MSNPKPKGPIPMGGADATQTADVNASPKVRFIANGKAVRAHRDMVDSDEFHYSCDYALLQYIHDLAPRCNDLPSSSAVGYQLRGAIDFVSTLKRLGEIERVPKRQMDGGALMPTEPARRQ